MSTRRARPLPAFSISAPGVKPCMVSSPTAGLMVGSSAYASRRRSPGGGSLLCALGAGAGAGRDRPKRDGASLVTASAGPSPVRQTGKRSRPTPASLAGARSAAAVRAGAGWVEVSGRGGRRLGRAPAEGLAGDPDTVEHHRELPGECHARLLEALRLQQTDRPDLQRAPQPRVAPEQSTRRDVEQAPHLAVAHPADPASA